MKTQFVRPAPGLDIRMPERTTGSHMPHLPLEGAEVPLNEYWRARLRDGDVVEAKPDKAKPKAEPDLPAAKK